MVVARPPSHDHPAIRASAPDRVTLWPRRRSDSKEPSVPKRQKLMYETRSDQRPYPESLRPEGRPCSAQTGTSPPLPTGEPDQSNLGVACPSTARQRPLPTKMSERNPMVRRMIENTSGAPREDPQIHPPKTHRQEGKRPLACAGLLAEALVRNHRGEHFVNVGKRAGSRHLSLAMHVAYAVIAGCGAWWLFTHPGRFDLMIIAATMLAGSAGIAIAIAGIMVFLSVKQTRTVVRIVRLTRRVTALYDTVVIGLAATSAALGLAVALYSSRYDEKYDTSMLRADAFEFALLAGTVSLMAHAVATRPVFSLIEARQRKTTYIMAAISRVLVFVALFASAAEALAPGTTTWIAVSATLFLTSAGWELASRARNEKAIDAIVEAAISLEGAALRGDNADLLTSLAQLETAVSCRTTAGGAIVESDVAVILRVCLARLHPWEAAEQPAGSPFANLAANLRVWDDAVLYDEIGKFSSAIRHSLCRNEPLITGDIWALPLHGGAPESDVYTASDHPRPRLTPLGSAS